MKTILNFRELSGINKEGKELKEGMIFRCGSTDNISDVAINYINKELLVDNIYDFRNDHEIKNDLDERGIFSIKKINILEDKDPNDFVKVINMSEKEIENIMEEIYREFSQSEGYSEFIKSILEQENPKFIFHCTAGKDRTGVAGVIMMKMLNFDDEHILEEYLKIDQNFVEILKQKMVKDYKLDENIIKKLEPFLTVKKNFISAYLDEVYKQYGTFDKYVEEKLNITKEQVKIFNEIYLKS